MSDAILVTRHETWVEITLNRPDRLNSFNDEMHLALRGAVEDARDSGVRAILLTGAGRGFCAGQDLGDRDPEKMGGPPDLGHTLNKFYNPLVRLLRSLEFPVICAVNGVAAGAGANLALACDIVLAGDNAKFIQSFAKVGLVPDAGGSWSLAHLAWGMIWKAIPSEDLMTEARALTKELSEGPTYGLGQGKQLIQQASGNDFDTQLDLEASVQKTCGESPDYAEGVSAFLRKRPAKFSGVNP